MPDLFHQDAALYTSYFANQRNIPAGLRPVGIAIKPPHWYRGPSYKALAPSYKMLKMPRDEYMRHFDAILADLDPHQVAEDLGAGAVLLCFEKPRTFCHRRVVAEWLEDALGIEVPELGYLRVDTPGWRELA